MRRDFLEIALMLGSSLGGWPDTPKKIRVVDEPKHTRNIFGPLSEIAGKELELVERNSRGDCLCLFTGAKGTNLVDVDHRDVKQNV